MTPDRLIDIRAVVERVGFSKTWIYQEIAAGRFPARVTIGASSRWSSTEVGEWIAARLATREAAQQTEQEPANENPQLDAVR